MSRNSYAFLVFLGGCSYGILSTIVKIAYASGFTVNDVCGSQGFFGMLLLWAVVLFQRKQFIPWKKTLLLVLCGSPIGLTTVFYYKSLQTLDASLAIIFLFQFIWIGVLLEGIFFRRIPTWQKIVAITVLLIGSLFATGIKTGTNNVFVSPGMIWGSAAAFSYSLVILSSGTVARDVSPILKSALMSIGATATIFCFLPPFFLTNIPVLLQLMPYSILLGLFGIALPPLLFSIGIPKIGVGLGSILTSSELPIAMLLSAFVLGEHIATLQWLGIIMILGGIIVGNLQKT
ncbi:MAG: DMT family transporter [Sporomusaceae bacterium]|nr:DMT family transporter [Sporomusaceae bacterium]